MVSLIDTHAHLDEQAFEQDLDDVLSRAAQAGVAQILTIGINAETSQRAVQLAEEHDRLLAVVGIQPNYVSQMKVGDWETILELAEHPRVVAIGETGLDRYWDYAPLDEQREWFRRHIDLACTIDKPFIVHCREADAEVLALLQDAARLRSLSGVMHSFCGDLEMAQACLNLGMHISFAGMLTYKRNQELRQTAAAIPDDRLLLETDSPYLAPVPMRGKRNEPANVVHTARCLAEERGLAFSELAALTTRNAKRLFRLS